MTRPEIAPDETRSPDDLKGYPRWLREIDARLPITAQFLLVGNTRDRYLIPTHAATQASEESPPAFARHSLNQALWSVLARSGFVCMVTYDSVDSWGVLPDTLRAKGILRELLVKFPRAEKETRELADVADVARAIVSPQTDGATKPERVAFLLPYASRLVASVGRLTPQENRFFLACAKLAHTANPLELKGRSIPVFNPILWVLDGERDVPHWLVAGNGSVQYVAIPTPTVKQRADGGHLVLLQNKEFRALTPPDRASIVDRLARRSEGLSLTGVIDAARLTRELPNGLDGIEEAVRIAKVGVVENPWRDKADLIRDEGYKSLSGRVLGQEIAVRKVLDILVRSATGLTGAHASGNVSRPRGVLFLAGPTGVGKTELAKAITELVFGDEDAYVRFDMSEFRSEHAGERLVGAPPGYVGFDAGGELTNAVRRQPMSVVLFDEIEKAHPRILDKFLQILSDGRLTDGTGATVYFTECVLVFTSNLGMFRTAREGDHEMRIANPDTVYDAGRVYETFDRHIKDAVEQYFQDIERPELLNRLGNNIVVLDYINDVVAHDIVDRMIGKVRERVKREFGVTLEVAGHARDTIFASARLRPQLGGKEIDSVVESALVNPLARYLFHNRPSAGATVTVESVVLEGGIWDLQATAGHAPAM